MKKLFFILSSIFLLCLPSTVAAQEKFEAEISAGVVSNYMWRGLNLAGVSLQPQVKLAWQGLSLEATANTGIDKEDLRDLDLTLDFSRWGFNIGITDYFNYNVDAKDRFFYYSGGEECPHALEANLGYTCKYGSIQAHTMFYGNDYKINGKRAYSTFIELDVPFRAAGLDWDVMVGITPFESAGVSHQEKVEGEDGKMKTVILGDWVYGDSFTCNMAAVRATKNLVFKHCRVPVFVEFHANPYLQRANFILGVAIANL